MLLASLPALLALEGAGLGGFLLRESLLAGFLAMQPVAVVAGGLLFHAAVSAPGPAEARPISAARIFAVSLPLGVFLESVTGFSVGAVFALSALRSMGVRGALAAALALQALTLVPWGGLGPGTSLGSAIAGVPPQEVARIAAWPTVLWLLLLVPWLWCVSWSRQLPVRTSQKRSTPSAPPATSTCLCGSTAHSTAWQSVRMPSVGHGV